MGLFSWRELFSRKRDDSRRVSGAVRKHHWRPSLEVLEDRVAPATDIWTGADAATNNKWSDPGNWTITNNQGQIVQGAIPQSGDNLEFDKPTSGVFLSTNDLTGMTFNAITFNYAGFNIGGNSITLSNQGGGSTLIGNASSDTVTLDISMGGNNGGSQNVTVASGETLTLSGKLTGVSGVSLVTLGQGTLILSGDNSGFNGPINVNVGYLEITNAKSLPSTSSGYATTVQSGAQLELSNVNGQIDSTLNLNSTGPDGFTGGLLNVAGNNTWSGSIHLGASVIIGANKGTSLNISGTIDATSSTYNLTKEGFGTLIFSGSNTYGGQTNVNNGILKLQNANALQGSSETIVNDTASEKGSLQLDDPLGVGFTFANELLVLNGPGFDPGTGSIGALDNLNGDNNWTGNIVLGNPSPNGVNVQISAEKQGSTITNLTLSGVISDPTSGVFTLTKIGPGRVILTNDNTYQGATNVSTGYLRIEDSNALGDTAGGTTVQTGASLELYADPNHTDSVTGAGGNLKVSEAITINGQGVGNTGGALHSIQGINIWNGGIQLASNVAAIGVDPDPKPASDSTYFTNNYSLTITKTSKNKPGITGGGGTTFDKVGLGQLILPDANGYVGPTDVQQGWITVENNSALGSSFTGSLSTVAVVVTVESGAAVMLKAPVNASGDVTTSFNLSQTFILNGTGISFPTFGLIDKQGALENLEGNNTISGLIQLNGNVGIGVEQVFADNSSVLQPSQLTTTNLIADGTSSGGIVKLGSQELDIQGPGTYTGAVDIKAGVIIDQNSTGLGAPGGGNVTVETGTALVLTSYVPGQNGGIASGLQILGKNLILNGNGSTGYLLNNPNPLSATTVNPNSTPPSASPPNIIAALTVLAADNLWGGNISMNNSSVIDVEPSARLTVNGVLDDAKNKNAGGSNLTKIGTGELVLGGTNTYQGVTYVNQGFLTITNGKALGTTAGGTVVANGATLQAEGNITVTGEALTIQGNGSVVSAGDNPGWFQQGPAPIDNGQAPGNANTAGRVTGVTVDPNNPNHIYISTADGGAWETVNGGLTWSQRFDAYTNTNKTLAPVFSGAIAIAPSDPKVIYLGTGEGDNSTDSYYGEGVYQSTDGGQNWTLLTNSDGSNPLAGLAVTQIAVDPSDSNRIFVATSSMASNAPSGLVAGIYRYQLNKGVGSWFNMTDVVSKARAAGQTSPNHTDSNSNPIDAPGTPGPDDDFTYSFPFPQGVNNQTPAASWSSVAIVNGVLYAALGTYTGNNESLSTTSGGNPPYGNLTTTVENAVFHCDSNTYTTNAPIWWIGTGDNTTSNPIDLRDGSEFPASSSNGNIKLAVSGPIVYAAITGVNSNALFAIETSSNSGQTWAGVSKLPPDYMGGQGQYASAIATRDGTTVYVAGSDAGTGNSYVFVTTDGGSTWTDISSKGPNTAVHTLWVDSNNNLEAGTDGGIWLYNVTSKTWTDINGNLAITQVNNVAVSPSVLGTAVAGSQYTGLETTTGSQAWTSTSVSTSDLTDNGGSVQIDPLTPTTYYSIQNGTLYKSTKSGAAGTWVAFTNIGVNVRFMAPIDVENTSRLVIGTANGVYESVNGGASWTHLNPTSGGSNILNTPVTALASATDQGVFQSDPDFTMVTDQGATNYDPNTIYAISNGNIYVTRNLGNTWVNRSIFLVSTVSAITVDPTNSNIAYAVSNAAAGSGSGRVFQTSDGGQHWTDVTGNLPDLPTWSVLVDPRTNTLYIGNDLGVYSTPASGLNGTFTQWSRVGAGLPDVQVRQLVLNQTTNTLTAATYGRSIFQLNLDDAPKNSGALRVLTGNVVWNGTITLTGSTTISVSGTQLVPNGISNASLNILGAIGDGGNGYGLAKVGQGTLILSGANTYSGATDIQQGVVLANNSQALGAASSPGATVENGAALELESSLNSVHLYLNGKGIPYNGVFGGALRNISGTNTYTGPITLQSNVTIGVDSNSSLTLTGVIDDGTNSYNLTKELPGTLILSGSNTYHGNTTVDQGILEITNGSALGIGSATTTVNDGAQLMLQAPLDANSKPVPFTVSGETLILGGTGVSGLGALLNNRGSNTWAGSVILTTNANPTGYPATNPTTAVAIGVASSSDTFTITSGVTEQSNAVAGTTYKNFGINKVGSGTLVLTAAGTLTGSDTVTAGTLNIQDSKALGNTTSDTITVNSGAALVLQANSAHTDSVTGAGGNLKIAQALSLSGVGVGPANAGALIAAAGDDTVTGKVVLANTSTIGAASGASLTLKGVVSGASTANLQKAGAGTLNLIAADTYTGQTLINAGIVYADNNTSLGGTGNGGVTVASGATLQIDQGITVSGTALTLNGTGVVSNGASLGALENVSGANTWSGNVAVSTDSLIYTPAGTLTLSGILSGSGFITKTGSGSLVITNAKNTYMGQATISGGTVQVDGTFNAVVLDSGTLAGTGTVGNISVTANGGTIQPGDPVTNAGSTGTLTATGNISLSSNTTFFEQINSDTSYGILKGSAAVGLKKAQLVGAVANNYTPSVGSPEFDIVQATGAGRTVSDGFTPSTVIFNNYKFQLGYTPTIAYLTRILANSTTTVSDSPNPSTYGQTVTFTATVAGEGGITTAPTGTVQFYVNGVAYGSPASLSLVGTQYQATITDSGLGVGTDTISATYGGDSNFNSSSGSATQTVGKASSTTTITLDSSTPNTTITYGDTAKFDITVTPQYSGTPSGTVSIYYNDSTNPKDLLGTVTLNSSGSATFTSSIANKDLLPGGTDTIIAVYGSDTNFNSSTSTGNPTVTVNALATTTSVSATWSTSPTNPVYSQPVTLTASVSDTPGVGTETGTVQFYDNGAKLGSAVNLSSGQASISVSNLAVGTDTITATYTSGDSNFSGSSGSSTVTVNKDTVTVNVAANPNIANPIYGQETITATISADSPGGGSGATLPSGTVTFTITGGDPASDGTSTATVTNGVATLGTLLNANINTYTITASFSGDTNYSANANSNSLSQTVSQASSSVTVKADSNPSVYGQTVTFTATVNPQFSGTPTGTVQFYENGTAIGSAVTLSNGQATFSVNNLSVGTDTITASYGGDVNFTSSSGSATQTVNKANTSITVTVDSSSPANPTYGQAEVFDATVTATGKGSGTPSDGDTITFYYNQVDSAHVLGTSTLTSGSTTFTTNSNHLLPAGSDTIIAVFSGDSNYNTSTSSGSGDATVTVSKANTTTGDVTATWSTSPSDPVYGQQVTLKASLTGTPGGETGTITFYNGTTSLGSATVSGTGTYSIQTTKIAAGPTVLTAVYSGDSNFNGSDDKSGTPPTVTVDKADTTTVVTSTAPSGVYGQPVITATVTANPPGGNTPAGSVKFFVYFGNDTTSLDFTETDTLNSSGVATLTHVLDVGTYTINASYLGNDPNGNYNASPVSADVTQVVTPAIPGMLIISSANPSSNGQSVTFTVVVAPPYGGTPTGQIALYINGQNVDSAIVSGGSLTYTTSLSGSNTPYDVSATFSSMSGNFTNSSTAIYQQVKLPPPASSGGSSGSINANDIALQQDTYFLLLDLAAMAQYGATSQLELFAYELLTAIYANPLYGTAQGNADMAVGEQEALSTIAVLLAGAGG